MINQNVQGEPRFKREENHIREDELLRVERETKSQSTYFNILNN